MDHFDRGLPGGVWRAAGLAASDAGHRARHGLAGLPQRQILGTHVVFGVGERIVKLFCPLWLEDFQAEQAALESIRGLPVPEIVARGALEGWPYLVLTRVEGVPAVDVWPRLSWPEKRIIVRQLGELMRRLHDQPLPPGLADDWPAFIGRRLAAVPAHHSLPEPWPAWIARQLHGFQEPALPHALLNSDLTEDHVLLVEGACGWAIGGLIDFGDARIGHPYYEFVAPLAEYTYGQPGLSRELVAAYGLEPTRTVRDALTRYCLLHEFGTLRDFLARHPGRSPQAFCDALWQKRPEPGTI